MRRTALALALCLWLAVPLLAAGAGEPEPAISPPPLASPEPSPDPSPTAPGVPPAKEESPTRLYVDNQNVYAYMACSYAQGYVPTVEGGTAYLVLPLLCQGELAGNCLWARAELGDPAGPFAVKNYERTVELALNPVNGGGEKVSGYWVCFPLELRAGRDNGSYPVPVTVWARDKSGGAVQEAFTVYVTITDGRDPDATPTPEPVPPDPTPEPAPLVPRLLVQSCQVESLGEEPRPGAVNAGESLRVTVTLKNASGAETMENILATAAPPGEGFTLLSPTDSFFWEALAPGDTVGLVQEYAVSPDVPAGQYTMGLSYDFAYHNGLAGAGAASVRVNISQPLKMEFPRLQLPAQAVVSDVVQVNVQAINLSHAKAYHVRATLEADGLLPSGTAYLGDLEGGASGEKPLQVTVTSLTGGEMPYGQTTGLVTYCYEDAGGTAYTQTASFTLDIASPFSGRGPEEKKNQPGQWWVIMGVLALALLGFGGLFAARTVRRRRG